MTLTKTLLISVAVLLSTAGTAAARVMAPPAFRLKTFARAPSRQTSAPDDVAYLNGHVFVGWQNGVGTKGQPAPKTHTTASRLVEYATSGHIIGAWSLAGKIGGLAGAPGLKAVVATANEDGHSHLFTVRPAARKGHQVTLYRYAPAPDSKGAASLHTGGGTGDVSVLKNGNIMVSASAPTRSGATATFRAVLSGTVARLFPTFTDNAKATDAVTGNIISLHLTDPYSNALVPGGFDDPFGGDYALNSQADQEVIFAKGRTLNRERLTYGKHERAGVDDIRWAPVDNATLYVVDARANRVYRVTGPFSADDALASMASLGSHGFTGVVASFNDADGRLSPFITGLEQAKGLLFTP